MWFLMKELLGHKDVATTMIYTQVLNRGGKGVRSSKSPEHERLAVRPPLSAVGHGSKQDERRPTTVAGTPGRLRF